MMLKRVHEVGSKVLGLVDRLTDMGPFPLRDEICMGVACYTLILSTMELNYSGHLQWDITRKSPTAWRNIYEDGECGSRRTIFARDERKLVANGCPTRGPWFVKFTRGEKLRMGIIRR